jgi:hypothetical protein
MHILGYESSSLLKNLLLSVKCRIAIKTLFRVHLHPYHFLLFENRVYLLFISRSYISFVSISLSNVKHTQ